MDCSAMLSMDGRRDLAGTGGQFGHIFCYTLARGTVLGYTQRPGSGSDTGMCVCLLYTNANAEPAQPFVARIGDLFMQLYSFNTT